MVDYERIEKLRLIKPGETVLAKMLKPGTGDTVEVKALLLGYDLVYNLAAIEFEDSNFGFHDCNDSNFQLIRPAKDYLGYFIDINNIRLEKKRPRLGR